MEPDTQDRYERVIAAEGRRGIYESNYLKANAPDGSGSFWLKHNLLVPPEGSDLPAVAEFWCALWGPTGEPRVWKQAVGLDAVRLSTERVEIVSDVASLTPGSAHGALTGSSGPVAWDLAIRDELPPLRHFDAEWMYTAGFPRKKVVTGSPRAVFTGSFRVGADTVSIDGWIGHRNHNWGTEHAYRYAYGGCNVWDDGADLTVEGFTVQVRLVGPVRSPWLTLLAGRDGGARYGAGSLRSALRSAGEVSWPEWRVVVPTSDGRKAQLRMELSPDRAAGLRYLHPSGALSYCYNVKDAETRLLLGGIEHRSRSGELEFLFPQPIPGIDLHGHATIDELRAEIDA